jgi:enoyl-CoA hydratase/carnithine racemase
MPLAVDISDAVAYVELQDPPHNFLSAPQVEELADVMHGLDENLDVRAVVLGAQGRSFCAGANFGGGDDRLRNSPSDLYAQAARLFEVGVPVIASVQGPAIGGGLGLAMSATFRVTCPEARFSANFVKLGIHQGFGLSVTLPELLGPSKAALVLLTGRRFGGEEATEIGLADLCVPRDQLRGRACELASEIATGAPLAIRSINRTLRAGLADRVRAATAHEAAEQARLFATEDAAEGMRSVNERRPGRFLGR